MEEGSLGSPQDGVCEKSEPLVASIPSSDTKSIEPAIAAETDEEKSKRERMRGHIAAEILSTEESYVRSLETLVDVFLNPLDSVKDDSSKSILSSSKIERVFSNIVLILNLNKNLLNTLRERIESFNSETLLGDVFVDFAHFFKMYTHYVNNHDAAIESLRKFSGSNPKLRTFLESCSTNPRCAGLNIESFLIMPIQRIPRYRLLLEQMTKFTKQDHPDYSSLKQALKLVSEVADKINQEIKKKEDTESMIRIQKLFGDQLVVVAPGRKFFLQEELMKQCRRTEKPFQFFLFSDILIYGTSKMKGVKLHRVLEINKFFEAKVVPDSEDQKPFRIRISSSEKSFLVYCPTSASRDLWIEKLNFCKKTSMEAVKSSHSDEEFSRAAPVWTPDSEKKECEICRCSFSMIKRRHHCRKCGRLVCDLCSKSRVPSKTKGKKERACDLCAKDSKLADSGSFNKSLSSSASESSLRPKKKSYFNRAKTSDAVEFDDTPKAGSDLAEALETCVSDIAGDLTFEKGDTIVILEKSDITWVGRNQRTGIEGKFDPKLVREDDSDSDNSKNSKDSKDSKSKSDSKDDSSKSKDEDKEVTGGTIEEEPEEGKSVFEGMSFGKAQGEAFSLMRQRWESVFISPGRSSKESGSEKAKEINPAGPCKRCVECKGFVGNKIMKNVCNSCHHPKKAHKM